MSDEANDRRPPGGEQRVPVQREGWHGLAIALSGWALANVAGAMWQGTRGLDLTDEGFYLNSISRPWDDHSSILLFGYAYHPLYLLFGGDIVMLRWAGLLITTLAVTLLAWVALGTPALVGGRPVPRKLRAVASVGLGALSPLSLVQFPLTPSYNSLTEQALALAATGLIVGLSRKGRRATAGWVLLGVAAWLTFLGKPTSAAAFAALVLPAVALLLRRSPLRIMRGLATALAGCLAAVAATLILSRLPPAAFLEVLANGLQTSAALEGHSDLVRWDEIPLSKAFYLALLAVVGLAVLGSAAYGRVRLRERWFRQAVVASMLLLGSAVLILEILALWRAHGLLPMAYLYGPATALGGALLALLCVLCSTAWQHVRRRPARAAPSGRDAVLTRMVLLLVLTLLPAVYAFGTNNNLWSSQGRAAAFPAIAVAALMAGRPTALLAIPLSGLLFLTPLQTASVLSPYRYPSLLSATAVTQLGSDGTVGLTPVDSARLARVRAIPRRVGLQPGTPIVDLTGDSPGYIHLLGGRAVGQAWIIGGYPGSNAAASLALAHDRCELDGAWVLAGVGQPRGIEESVLHEFGLDLHRDFRPVANFERLASGGSRPPTEIYAPTRAIAQPGCS
ncbi:hypothetical protein [Intrasporangium chromatireducens]|nr:hypothetical protein [Intrasporangium chromatireducens]